MGLVTQENPGIEAIPDHRISVTDQWSGPLCRTNATPESLRGQRRPRHYHGQNRYESFTSAFGDQPEVFGQQFAVLAGLQISQPQSAEADALQPGDFMIDGREHAPDLAVLSFQ